MSDPSGIMGFGTTKPPTNPTGSIMGFGKTKSGSNIMGFGVAPVSVASPFAAAAKSVATAISAGKASVGVGVGSAWSGTGTSKLDPLHTTTLATPFYNAASNVVGQVLGGVHATSGLAKSKSPTTSSGSGSSGGSNRSSNPGGGSSSGGSADGSSDTPSGGSVAPVSTDTTGSIDPLLIIGAGALAVLFLRKKGKGGVLGGLKI